MLRDPGMASENLEWRVEVHAEPGKVRLVAALSASPPLELHAEVASYDAAIDLLERWFSLCEGARYKLCVTSAALPPELHETRNRNIALHFIATALELPNPAGAGLPDPPLLTTQLATSRSA